MPTLRKGTSGDCEALASLILSSAPTLLPYLFQGSAKANEYIRKAGIELDGQYSAMRHQVAVGYLNDKPLYSTTPTQETSNETVLGCITLWQSQMPDSFYEATIKSLSSFLSSTQIRHLLDTNSLLMNTFKAPLVDELCIGHLAVIPAGQKMGIGRTLIGYAIEQAKIKDKKVIVLDVDSANQGAIRFYKRCGFVIVNESFFAPTSQSFSRMSYEI